MEIPLRLSSVATMRVALQMKTTLVKNPQLPKRRLKNPPTFAPIELFFAAAALAAAEASGRLGCP